MNFYMHRQSFIFLFLLIDSLVGFAQSYTYVELDSTRTKWGDYANPDWLRYFGTDAGDVNADGRPDIVAGRYVYLNPGDDLTATWTRRRFPMNLDGFLVMDVDGDEYADIIAMALPRLYWLEATNERADRYRIQHIGDAEATWHVNSQGFTKGQLIPGGKEEIIIAGNGNIFAFEIQADGSFKRSTIAENTSDEGIGVGDLDGDGDLDIAAGRRPEGETEPTILVWYENPGKLTDNWKGTVVGNSSHPIDRVMIADLTGDGQNEIVMTQERYPGLEADAEMIYWKWTGPSTIHSDKVGMDAQEPKTSIPRSDLRAGKWQPTVVVTQYSMNNLNVADLDNDGDLDLLTNEHKGEALALQLWTNDGQGNFTKTTLDQGKEMHLGALLADFNNDGKPEIFGHGWDNWKYMHLWIAQ